MINGEIIRGFFFFYIRDEHYKETVTNKMHFEYWKRYFHIFDELTFIVSFNSKLSSELMDALYRDFQMLAIDLLPLSGLRFEREINNPYYRETKAFENHISNKMRELDGFTFWGHNKGTTNTNQDDTDNESIYRWLSMIYYGCFEHFEEDTSRFGDMVSSAYGGPKVCVTYCDNTYHWIYAGGMFWGIYNKIYNLVKYDTNIMMPTNTGRWYAEQFLGNLLPPYIGITYHCQELHAEDLPNLYLDALNLATILYGQDYTLFDTIHNSIMSRI